jgi:hypothetical protein
MEGHNTFHNFKSSLISSIIVLHFIGIDIIGGVVGVDAVVDDRRTFLGLDEIIVMGDFLVVVVVGDGFFEYNANVSFRFLPG